jgi:type II secretory pathway pseudopilin PulG
MTMSNLRQTGQIASRSRESGYSLLMVIFLVATSLIVSAAVVPNILTQGRREREEDMIWRGEQYERAIGMYYKKFGKYPTKVDDLTNQTNGVRFLRKAYTDPMNKEDGSWRFIYVGPNGQLIGSVHSTNLLQSALTGSTPQAASTSPFGALGSAVQSALSTPGATPGTGTPATGATGTGTPGATTPGTSQTNPQSSTGSTLAPDSLAGQSQPLGGAVIGGNIIGVGSKIKKPSLRVYKTWATYQEWEFIWNPTLQGTIPGQGAAVAPATAPTGQQPLQPQQQNPSGNGNVPLSTQPVQPPPVQQ